MKNKIFKAGIALTMVLGMSIGSVFARGTAPISGGCGCGGNLGSVELTCYDSGDFKKGSYHTTCGSCSIMYNTKGSGSSSKCKK